MGVVLQNNLHKVQTICKYSSVMQLQSTFERLHIEIHPSAGLIQERNEFGQSGKETYLRSIRKQKICDIFETLIPLGQRPSTLSRTLVSVNCKRPQTESLYLIKYCGK
jgi:hypothetical protein